MTTIPPMPKVFYSEPSQPMRYVALGELDSLKVWGTAGWARVQGLEAEAEDVYVQHTLSAAMWKSEERDWTRERDALRNENERFRTLPEYQFQATYNDLCDTMGIKPGGSVIDAVDALKARAKDLETKYSDLCKDIAEWHPVADCAQEIHDLRAKLEAAETDIKSMLRVEEGYLRQSFEAQKQAATLAEALESMLDAFQHPCHPGWPAHKAMVPNNELAKYRATLRAYREGR